MDEEIPKGIIFTSQISNQPSAKKDLFLGACLFLGLNFLLLLAESAIISFFWAKDVTFFTDRSSYQRIVVIGTFSFIFLINLALFIYLIRIKRPAMSVSILATPVLILLPVVGWCIVMVFLFLAWIALLLLHSIGLV